MRQKFPHQGYQALEVEAKPGPADLTVFVSLDKHGVPVAAQPPADSQAEARPHSVWSNRLYTMAWSLLVTAGVLVLACSAMAIVLATGQPPPGRPDAAAAVAAGATLAQLGADVDYGTLLKPAFHISPERGPNGSWLNDPNGMFQFNGLTHVFYQLNPNSPVWGKPYWGHVVSRNLAHWRRLPIALSPDQWFDRDGVFSGSATLVEGVPTILYTGVMNFSQYGFFYQLQAFSVPAPGDDPYYVTWEKPARGNPLALSPPPGGSHAQFRDPTTAWRAGSLELASVPPPGGGNVSAFSGEELWFSAVGALDDCIGSAALYSSPDLRTWTYYGTLFSQLAQNYSVYNECLDPNPEGDVPPGTKGFGGTCDQFGPDCHMWECPDFFTVAPSVLAFKYSDQVRDRQPFGGDWYVLGSAPLSYKDAPAQDGTDAFTGQLNGEHYPAKLMDYGAVYASKTFELEDGRRVWLGWVYEDSLGCQGMCGDGTDFIKELGWQGIQSLPRLVSYDAASQSLVFTSLPELRQLRLGLLYTGAVTMNLTGLEEADGGLGMGDDGDEQEEDMLFSAAAVFLASGTSGCSGNGSVGVGPWLQQVRSTHVAFAVLVPRQVALNASSATLADASRNHTCVLGPSSPAHLGARGLPPCAGGLRRQLEVLANFSLMPQGTATYSLLQQANDLQKGAGSFSFVVGFELLTGNSTSTAVFLNGTAEIDPTNPAGATLQVTRLDVFVDKSRSGGMTSPCVQGGPVDLPPGGVPASHLTLHAYIDRSVVEVFALEGHGRVTARIYPLVHDAAWGVRTFGAVGTGVMVAPLVAAQVEVYELDQCWRDEV